MDRLGNRRCRARRAHLPCPMRPRGVVVGHVPGKHPAQVLLTKDQHPVGDLSPNGQHEAFGKQFARGHRGGILTTSMPASAMTASNELAY